MVTKAEAEAEMRHVAILQKGQQPKWSAWWLARRHPQRWAAADHTEVTVTVPYRLRTGQVVQLPERLAVSLKRLREEEYVDPRSLPPAEPEETEPAEPRALDDGPPDIDPSRKPNPVIIDAEPGARPRP